MFRRLGGSFEVLLGHMGGPLWARRDAGAWTVPKGEYDAEEAPQDAARREFREELGLAPPDGELLELGSTRQSGGKHVTVWAVEGDVATDDVVPGTFAMEWPKGSGRIREFPELDRVAWFGTRDARERVVRAQVVFLDRLTEVLGG